MALFIYYKSVRTNTNNLNFVPSGFRNHKGLPMIDDQVAVKHFTGCWSIDAVKLHWSSNVFYICCRTEAFLQLSWILPASPSTGGAVPEFQQGVTTRRYSPSALMDKFFFHFRELFLQNQSFHPLGIFCASSKRVVKTPFQSYQCKHSGHI